jgi:hypothetical protein
MPAVRKSKLLIIMKKEGNISLFVADHMLLLGLIFLLKSYQYTQVSPPPTLQHTNLVGENK